MRFRWDQTFPPEYGRCKPPPAWLYLTIFVVLLCIFAGGAVLTWPKGKPVDAEVFLRIALALPVMLSLVVGLLVFLAGHDHPAYAAAIRNSARWELLKEWRRQAHSRDAVLDSVVVAPEPDLAERMLKLEGSPPENPGKVMRLENVVAADDRSRRQVMVEKLLAPLLPKLAQAIGSDSFDIVLQCDDEEPSADVLAAWRQLELPGTPRIRRIDNDTHPEVACIWFEDESHPYMDLTPKYRLVLAWHLHDATQEAPPTVSEAAVALLLGMPRLMQAKPDTKRQAWLLRQIVSDADRMDRSLALLLRAEQVSSEHIRHFWYARLKGLARYSTLGAVRDADIEVEEHALDQAIGPQAPVARWLLAALAAKMAHFGQGGQLVALPHGKGSVMLNLVVREPDPVNLPWKAEYGFNPAPFFEFSFFVSLWCFIMLVLPDKSWGTLQTVTTVVVVVLFLMSAVWRIFLVRLYSRQIWNQYG